MRQGEMIINYGVLLGPLVVGVSLSILLPFVYAWPVVSTLVLGLSFILCSVLLVYAKLPSLSSGKLVTFGISSIKPERKKYYVLAYVSLFTGIMLSLAIVSISRI